MNNQIPWDVIVVGGGPAGMMAAGAAAKNGSKVLLIEKNETLGKKLLLTGGGRCNLTNLQFDNRQFLAKFKDDGKFLFSAFSQWSVKETLDFFHRKGLATKVEKEQRVFPASDSARSVLDALVRNMQKFGVTVFSNSSVTEIVKKDGLIIGVELRNKKIIRGRSVIIATGGASRPDTGSTGDGYLWLKNIGHTIIEPEPSLVPVMIKDPWIKKLAGVSLSGVKINLFQGNEKQDSAKGKILFTHIGVSGPAILNMSRKIGELLKHGEVAISIDLLPAENYGALNAKLQDLFKKNHKKKFRNALPDIIPAAIAPIIAELSGINPQTECNSVTKEQRLKLIQLLKGLPLNAKKLLGAGKAIITSGGVALNEIDFKTMRSRLFPNLYLIGDILNIDRPSGGYSLQLCWTTGAIAGANAAKK